MDFGSLHALLRNTYNEMMPLCGDMIGVARGIAGLGALFYLSSRVWSSLVRAESIDLFPLLRPFVLGICIMLFPSLVLGSINTILSPIVQGTELMVNRQESELVSLKEKRDKLQEEAYLKDPMTAYLVSNEQFDAKIEEMGIIGAEDAVTIAGMYAERASYQTKKWFKEQVETLLEFLFNSAGLVIDTLRTFFLIVLSILGPIVFGIAVWDGLSASLTAWFSRYISVYLWLPVSSILSALLTKIQILMLQNDIRILSSPDYSPEVGTWYHMVFFIIGIIGYFSVPTVAGWIIEAGGGVGSYGRNVNQTAQRGARGGYSGAKAGAAMTGAGVGNLTGRVRGGLLKGE